MNEFKKESINWDKNTDKATVTKTTSRKAIDEKYEQLSAVLGTSDGRMQKCGMTGWVKQKYSNGAIYCDSEAETYAVYGAIYARYTKMQSENGVLGFPKTDELGGISNGGRYNRFEKGSIYWTPATGACALMQIGEVSIPFSQSVQEPDLQAQVNSLQAQVNGLQAQIDSLSKALNLFKAEYAAHTHSYPQQFVGVHGA